MPYFFVVDNVVGASSNPRVMHETKNFHEMPKFVGVEPNVTKKLPNFSRSFAIHKAICEGLYDAKPTTFAFVIVSHGNTRGSHWDAT